MTQRLLTSCALLLGALSVNSTTSHASHNLLSYSTRTQEAVEAVINTLTGEDCPWEKDGPDGKDLIKAGPWSQILSNEEIGFPAMIDNKLLTGLELLKLEELSNNHTKFDYYKYIDFLNETISLVEQESNKGDQDVQALYIKIINDSVDQIEGLPAKYRDSNNIYSYTLGALLNILSQDYGSNKHCFTGCPSEDVLAIENLQTKGLKVNILMEMISQAKEDRFFYFSKSMICDFFRWGFTGALAWLEAMEKKLSPQVTGNNNSIEETILKTREPHAPFNRVYNFLLVMFLIQ